MAVSKPFDIMSDLKINFFNARTFKLDDLNKKFNLRNNHGLFFLAICSNNKIENIDNKLYLFRDALDELSSQEEHELNHLDQLRELNKKKDEDLVRLRELNKKKDKDIEHLRNIINEIHESSSWKLLTKLDFLKKDDSSDKDTDS